LALVPYKFYNTEEEKFEHWAINPKIYDIVNMLYSCFSLPIVETVQVLSDYGNDYLEMIKKFKWSSAKRNLILADCTYDFYYQRIFTEIFKGCNEKVQFKTKQTYFYNIDKYGELNPNDYRFQDKKHYIKTIHSIETYYIEYINKLNNFSTLVQSVQIPAPIDLTFMNFEDNMQSFNLNSNNVNQRVVPIQYYPDLDGNRKVDFEINVSAGITNALKLFDKLYASLQTHNGLNSKDKIDIFSLELEEEDSSSIAVDLFYYDYLMYRQEQQKHILKYFNKIIEMPQKLFKKLFKRSSKEKLYIEILKIILDSKITQDAIRKKIKKITDALRDKEIDRD